MSDSFSKALQSLKRNETQTQEVKSSIEIVNSSSDIVSDPGSRADVGDQIMSDALNRRYMETNPTFSR